jgi:hypothetical protein
MPISWGVYIILRKENVMMPRKKPKIFVRTRTADMRK